MLFYLLLINIFIVCYAIKNDQEGFLQGILIAITLLGSIIFWTGIGLSKLL